MPIGLWKTATQFTHRANRLYCYKVYDLNNLYFLTRVVHFYSATLVQFYSALDSANLELKSQPGKGSCFYFTLGLPPKKGAIQKRSERTGKVLRLATGHDVTALVVDDVKENRDVLRLLLKSISVKVVCAENGQEAIDLLPLEKPDIIFMDIRMPVMGGEEAIGKIQKQYGPDRFKIVAITASVLGELVDKYTKLGFHYFIAKPFRDEQIFSCLKNLLGIEFEYEKENTREVEKSVVNNLVFSEFSVPEKYLVQINNAAEIYNVTDMQNVLKKMSSEEPASIELIKHLEGLLKKYDMEEIQNVIEQVKVKV